jgi:hypothetical protein
MSFLFDPYQQGQINDAADVAHRAHSKVASTRDDVSLLQRRVETLALTCQALWEQLRERTQLTDEQLLQKMHEIDLRDGRADGMMSRSIVKCPKCDRPNGTNARRCIYCMTDMPVSHVFAQE